MKKEIIKLIANHPNTFFWQNDDGSWHFETSLSFRDPEIIEFLRKLLSRAQDKKN